PSQSRGNQRSRLELIQMDVCVNPALLQRVLCIFLVAQQRECGAKEFGAVANEDWRKRIGISCECALNEPPFFGCRARINRLARACRYLGRQVRPSSCALTHRASPHLRARSGPSLSFRNRCLQYAHTITSESIPIHFACAELESNVDRS